MSALVVGKKGDPFPNKPFPPVIEPSPVTSQSVHIEDNGGWIFLRDPFLQVQFFLVGGGKPGVLVSCHSFVFGQFPENFIFGISITKI